MNRRTFLQQTIAAGIGTLGTSHASALLKQPYRAGAQHLSIHLDAIKRRLPHAWEGCVGSDRAVVGLREQWLNDLDVVKKTVGVRSVRFHGLFNDEMGVWPEGSQQPNFLYVDMVYDAMLERGVKPLVELSFMPGALASGKSTIFWYHGNTTPPKSMKEWRDLVRALATHLVKRYGADEVSTWNFEVWNEPNLIYFWTGSQADYFELYRQAAVALKEVDKRLKVGGPATARASWVPDFLEYCSSQQVPVDFVSTHIYPDDPQKIVFGEDTNYPVEEVIPRALARLKDQIAASKFPGLPLFITEWSSQNPAFIAHTIGGSVGLADMMSYWTFDNVFEELGIPKTFLNTHFGLLGMRGVPRPSFNTFELLHRLGDVQLKADEGPILATRRSNGAVAIMMWNLIPQPLGVRTATGDPTIQSGDEYSHEGQSKVITLALHGAHSHYQGRLTRVDANHGNITRAYQKMGSPAYPTVRQIAELKREGALPEPERIAINTQNQITITVPPNGVALLEFE